jgi:uncharacterized hydrophobic protein (TIGR00271 family)
MIKLFARLKKSEIQKLEFISNIINASSPKFDFYLLISLATALVSLGIVSNNLVLIIAGMIIAPLLSSLLAVSLGVTCGSVLLIWRSLKIFILSIFIGFLTSLLVGIFFPLTKESWTFLNIMEVNYLSFAVALIAGITAAYTWRRPNTKDALPGIAIAVTLIPPLAALGLLIAIEEWEKFIDVFQFFSLNVGGILLAGLLLFFIPNLSSTIKAKKLADKEVKNETLNNIK